MVEMNKDKEDIFGELNAQDEVASMMEDNEINDQLEEIGKEQRASEAVRDSARAESVNVPESAPQEVLMGSPVKGAAAGKAGGAGNFEALLDNDSGDGGIVVGVEESFDFNPPEAVHNAVGVAPGFEDEFTKSLLLEGDSKD